MLLSFTAKGPMHSSASCDACEEGSSSTHRIKPRGTGLWIPAVSFDFFFFFFSISFFFLRQLERLNCNEELIGASAQRLSKLSPTHGATLSHALMRGAFCSTVLLLLPFLHSLALAGAGTRREARVVLPWIPTHLCL